MNLLIEKKVKSDTIKRLTKQSLIKEYKKLKKIQHIQQFLQALPYYAFILNENGQVIVSNKEFLEDHGTDNVNKFFGKKPGEIFQCENSNNVKGICGISKKCPYCGILNTINECRIKKKLIADNCRIIANKNNNITAYDFAVKCSPININDQILYFITLADISYKNRKNAIEKIFFHDVINLVGNLRGIVSLLGSNSKDREIKEYIEILSNITEQLMEEIISQRDLSAAEKNNLIINNKDVTSFEIIKAVINNTNFIENTKRCSIVVAPDSSDFKLHTDPVLLKRILINMVKNAIEASQSDSQIKIGSNKNISNAHFFVHNNNYIPEEIQAQIFRHSFSTKASDRGLGTYSMRLIGENYLHGKVYFTSEKLNGTTFSIELPLNK